MKKKTGAKKTRLLTRRELAAKLGVYMSTISKWEQSGMPIAEPGRRGHASLYDLAAVQKWRADREKAAKQNGTVDLQRERARKERAQALVAEQTHAIRAGKLLRAEDVAETWAAEIAAARSKVLAWSSTLPERLQRASELEGVRGIEKEINAATEELLLELASPGAPADKPKASRTSSSSKKKKRTKASSAKKTRKKARR